MKKQKLLVFALAIVLSTALALPVYAVTTVTAGWEHGTPQLFPLGDLITLNEENEIEDVDLGTLPNIFRFSIQSDAADAVDSVYLHIELTASNAASAIFNFNSDVFLLSEWVNEGNGYFSEMTNREFDVFVDNNAWLSEGENTEYIEVEDFLDTYLSGSSLIATTYLLTIEVVFVHAGSDGVLGTSTPYTESIVVYPITQPQLSSPMDRTSVASLPLLMSWSWTGGPNPATNWEMIVVETDQEEFDYISVIENASQERIRFQGAPISPTSHVYIGGSGLEQFLTPGKWYYWRVSVDVQTMTAATMTAYSDVRSFYYSGGGGIGGNSGSSGSGRGPGGEGGGGGGNVGGDDNLNTPTGSEGEADLPTNLANLVELLRPIVPQGVLQAFIAELAGYDVSTITIDGQSGMTLQDITQLLAQPGFEFISAELE